MRLPNYIVSRLEAQLGSEEADEMKKDWFLLTLNNYKYLDDGDKIGFINCDNQLVYTGHLFKGWSDDWKKIQIYHNTQRRIPQRIISLNITRNIFFFKKIKPNDAFNVYYMLHSI